MEELRQPINGMPQQTIDGIRTREELIDALAQLRRVAAWGTRRQRVPLEELARHTDIPLSTLHSYVTGKRLPAADVLDRVVYALGARGAARRAWAGALERVVEGSAPPATANRSGWLKPPDLVPGPALVGRETSLRALDMHALPRDGSGSLVTITGDAGIGKSALASSWAHANQKRFPHGVFIVNLRGHSGGMPVSAEAILARLLTTLGQDPQTLPKDIDELSALLRSELAPRRMLLVLDNAMDASHIDPLLPGVGASSVIVTSRSPLQSLVVRSGAVRIPITPLDDDAALALLGRDDRAAIDACEGNPLALRLARTTPHGHAWSGTGVASVLADTYRRLDACDLANLRKLAVTPGPLLGIRSVRIILQLPEDDLIATMDSLVSAGFLTNRQDSWERHDAVTVLTRADFAATTSPDERAALRQRLHDHVDNLLRQASADITEESWQVLRWDEDGLYDYMHDLLSGPPTTAVWRWIEQLNQLAARHRVAPPDQAITSRARASASRLEAEDGS